MDVPQPGSRAPLRPCSVSAIHPGAGAHAVRRRGAADPLLAALTERGREVTGEAERVRAQIGELTARLGEMEQELDHLRITGKTLTDLAADLAEPPPTRPDLPERPLYPQILAAFTTADQPLRARDLCEALDLGFEPKSIENMCSKLKRLVGRGILTETEPGLFTQNRP